MRLPHIYLTELESNTRIMFPMLPESIQATIGAKFISYDIMSLGDVQLPRGQTLKRITWSGILPGPSLSNQPFVLDLSEPKALRSQLEAWNKGAKLRLLITEISINQDVYIESLDITYQGAGDYHYEISLVEAREIKILVDTNAVSISSASPSRPTAPPAKTYTVKKGDSLWAIAQSQMGNGNKYPQLYEANKGVIDPRNQKYNMPKYTIYAGQVLTIPA